MFYCVHASSRYGTSSYLCLRFLCTGLRKRGSCTDRRALLHSHSHWTGAQLYIQLYLPCLQARLQYQAGLCWSQPICASLQAWRLAGAGTASGAALHVSHDYRAIARLRTCASTVRAEVSSEWRSFHGRISRLWHRGAGGHGDHGHLCHACPITKRPPPHPGFSSLSDVHATNQ